MQEYGIVIGRDGSVVKEFGGTEHVALHSPTRRGKTSGFAIPACFNWEGSLVCLDVKGECFDATAGYRSAIGQDIYLLAPAMRYSHCFDPLIVVDRDKDERFEQIDQLAFTLFPDIPSASASTNSSEYWVPLARQAWIAVATLIAESPPDPLTVANVVRFFVRGDGPQWLAKRVLERRATKRPYSQPVVDGLSDYLSGDERQVNGIRSSVTAKLGVWFNNPRIAAATSRADFDLRDIRRRPMTIYVQISVADIPRYQPMLRLFFDQLISLNSASTPAQDPSLKHQTLIIADEYAQLQSATLAHATQTAAGFGMRLAFCIQDKAQLRGVIGDSATSTLFNNVGAELVFGVNDLSVAQELEKRLGNDTVDARSVSRPRFMPSFKPSKQSTSDQPHARPLRLAQEILSMPYQEQYVLRSGMPPGFLDKIEWWKDPNFARLRRPPPPIPELKVQIAYDDGSIQIRTNRPRGQSGLTQDDIRNADPNLVAVVVGR